MQTVLQLIGRRSGGALRGLVALGAAAGLLAAPAGIGDRLGAQGYEPMDAPWELAAPDSYDMREYPMPESPTHPAAGRAHSIGIGPDGRLWYSGIGQHNVGMFDPSTETFRIWDTPTQPSRPHAAGVGKDGSVWLGLTALPINKVARFDPATEQFTEYLLGRPFPYPHTIWVAHNGDVFFTYEYGDGVGRINPATGELTEWSVPTKRARPYGIQEGPDGGIWFLEFLGNKIGRLDPATGQIREWAHPAMANDPGTRRLAIDAQGRIWFGEHEWGSIGVFDPANETWKSWWMPRQNGRRDQAYALNFDSKGYLWVSNFGGNYIGRFDPRSESWTVYPHISRSANCRLMGIDANDVLWCPASGAGMLVRLEIRWPPLSVRQG